MDNPLNNLDEAVAALEKKAIRTSQGVFVRMDDVKKMVEERKDASAITEEEQRAKPKDMNGAKQAILRDPEVMKNFPPPSRTAGRSVSANEPQSSSRT